MTGTDCNTFISKNAVPVTKKVAYANIVCDYRPLKSEKYRVCLTVGGNKLEYDFDSALPVVSLIETKLLLNSLISDSSKGA